ncbi:acetyl-CoA synthetase, partial [Halolamina salina]
MDVVGDLLGRDRRSDRPALVVDGRERSYHELITNAYKAGNVLRYHGVGEGRTVAVAPVLDLPPLLAFLGAAQL